MPRKSLILNKGQAFRGREEVSLLVHACYSIFSLFFLPNLFFFFSRFVTLLFPLFSFQLLLVCYSGDCCCCCESLVMIVAVLMILLCTTEVPYILPAVTSFLPFHPLTTFVQVWISFQITYWFVNYPATTIYLYWPCLPITKQRKLFSFLFYLFTVAFFRNSVVILSYYPSWHAPSGSNSSFPLLGGMSSQWDISPKRV